MQTAWQEEQSEARWDGDAISMTQGNTGSPSRAVSDLFTTETARVCD